MRLIKDLGLIEYGTKGLKKRYGIYECPICLSHFTTATPDVKSSKTTKCRCCADKISAKVRAEKQIAKAAEEFISTCSNIHNNKYDYSLVEYTGAYAQVLIICPVHGIFSQSPTNHKEGSGCPTCASSGFNKNKKAILYYIKIIYMDVIVYKVGITNRTVQERFSNSDLEKITIVHEEIFTIGSDARDKEQTIIKQYAEYKYTGKPILQNGNTELFIKDILGLDKDSN